MSVAERLMARYLEVLELKLGLDASPGSVDSDHDTSVVRVDLPSGLRALIWLDGHDPSFLHLMTMLPGLEEELTPEELTGVANTIGKIKCASGGILPTGHLVVNAETLVSADGCLPTTVELEARLPRMLRILSDAVGEAVTAASLAPHERDAADS